jgi:hypothetical protein
MLEPLTAARLCTPEAVRTSLTRSDSCSQCNREQRAEWASSGVIVGGSNHLDQQGRLAPYAPEQLLPRKRKQVRRALGHTHELQAAIG